MKAIDVILVVQCADAVEPARVPMQMDALPNVGHKISWFGGEYTVFEIKHIMEHQVGKVYFQTVEIKII